MRRSRGFTIVELLIVIAIIAVLMSILIPALAVAKAQATGAVCLGNQRGLIQAWVLYANDNRGYIVGGDTLGYRYETTPQYSYQHCDWVDQPQDAAGNLTATSPTKSVPDDEQRGIAKGALFKYVGASIKVYHCPGDRRYLNGSPAASGWRSYSIAGHLNGSPLLTLVSVPYLVNVKKIEDIAASSDKYVFVEEAETVAGYNARSWVLDPTGKYPTPPGNCWYDPVAIWHNDKSTLSFADGHAATYVWRCQATIQASRDGIKIFSCPTHPPTTRATCPDLVYMQLAYPHGGLK